jgi:hypothetical protein
MLSLGKRGHPSSVIFHPDQCPGWFKPMGLQAEVGLPFWEIQSKGSLHTRSLHPMREEGIQ